MGRAGLRKSRVPDPQKTSEDTLPTGERVWHGEQSGVGKNKQTVDLGTGWTESRNLLGREELVEDMMLIEQAGTSKEARQGEASGKQHRDAMEGTEHEALPGFPLTVITDEVSRQANVSAVLGNFQQHRGNIHSSQTMPQGLEGLVKIPIDILESNGVLKDRNSQDGLARNKKINNSGKKTRNKWARSVEIL